MIAKEWLEDIKERFAKYESDYNLNGEDVEWLIQQAERVEELGKLSDNLKHELFSARIERDLLKEEVKALKKSVDFLEKQRERMGNNHQQTIKDAGLLLKQNKRYKQALEEILNLEMDISNIQYADAVITTANKALKGESK